MSRWRWTFPLHLAMFGLSAGLLYPCLRDLLETSAYPMTWTMGGTLTLAVGVLAGNGWRRNGSTHSRANPAPVESSLHRRMGIAILAALALVLSFAALAVWDRTEHAHRGAHDALGW